MSDRHEKKAADASVERRKRGPKPKGRTAMTAAQRKREQRSRCATNVAERDDGEWTEAECFWVLTGKQWRGTLLDKAAWLRLGQLRGFCDSHENAISKERN
jgi:hypothetical protein